MDNLETRLAHRQKGIYRRVGSLLYGSKMYNRIGLAEDADVTYIVAAPNIVFADMVDESIDPNDFFYKYVMPFEQDIDDGEIELTASKILKAFIYSYVQGGREQVCQFTGEKK